MSSSDKGRGNLANGTPPPVGTDAYAAWLERMSDARAPRSDHQNLYLVSFKHWADKVKGSQERPFRLQPRNSQSGYYDAAVLSRTAGVLLNDVCT
jgi:hypothetical protein